MTKYIKRVSVGAFFKKGEDFKEGDTVTIANEGKPIEGKFGTQDVFMIKLADGREGNVSFNTTTINNLIDAYGEEAVNWVGKQVKVTTMRQNVQGKIINIYYFFSPNTEFDETTGQFVIKSNEQPPITDEQIKENLEDFDNIQ